MLTPQNILVVGGGLTGAAAGRALCRLLPTGSNVVVWEALDVLGGRFHTERTTDGGACDTGAQYVTVTDDAQVAAENTPLYAELTSAGILAPLRGRIEGGRAADGGGANYVAPAGLSSVVSHLFASVSLEPTRSRRAVRLRTAPSERMPRASWEVSAHDGHVQTFDGVVLTQPLPEMLSLIDSGDAATWLTPTEPDAAPPSTSGLRRAAMSAIQYSSRYALTLFFPPSAASTFASEIDWVARYITKDEDDAIVYLGHDSAKRAAPAATPVSLIIHTSVPYGIRLIKEGAAEDDVAADLLARVKKLLPWLPEPQQVVVKTWKVSQVRTPLALPEAAPTTACWLLTPPTTTPDAAAPPPPLVLAGDAFSPLGSRFDGCIQSGEGAAQAMVKALA